MGTSTAVFTGRAAGRGARTAVSTGCPTPVSPRRRSSAGGRRGTKGLTWSIFKSTEVGTDGRNMCPLRTGLWKWWRCSAKELAWLPTSWTVLLAYSSFSRNYLCSKSLSLSLSHTHTHTHTLQILWWGERTWCCLKRGRPSHSPCVSPSLLLKVATPSHAGPEAAGWASWNGGSMQWCLEHGP